MSTHISACEACVCHSNSLKHPTHPPETFCVTNVCCTCRIHKLSPYKHTTIALFCIHTSFWKFNAVLGTIGRHFAPRYIRIQMILYWMGIDNLQRTLTNVFFLFITSTSVPTSNQSTSIWLQDHFFPRLNLFFILTEQWQTCLNNSLKIYFVLSKIYCIHVYIPQVFKHSTNREMRR